MTGVTAGVGFSGWGFSMSVGADKQDKVFSSNETSEVVTFKREFDIEPKKSLIGYQKVYTFQLKVWFMWKSRNEFDGRELVYSYSSAGDVDAVIKECVQTISCDEWYFSNDKLASDTAHVTLPRPAAREPKGAVCQWKNMNGASQHQIRTKYPSAAP
ncbi:hypothetical protein AA0114_g12546 [Alternaria tenuissima]|uniref:Uncharacterized protein n=1 Tax=Alternaria tenuissima TaxID=119927 RepID=A0A4Q4LYM1_9PLEO|nr:hypothetical protein AA0114_g12546 [Alternaria tenuissima]